jgi:molecular chaperone Hsp33
MAAPAADFVLPFDLAAAGVRGRMVRLDATSARALSPHDLPEEAGRLAGEMLALATLLGSLLKLDGRLTVQIQGDGPVDLVVADYYGRTAEAPRGVRGLARVDAERFAALGANPDFIAMTGEGALAVTVRPSADARAYQGVVALDPQGISASAEAYFRKSEQLATLVRLAAAPVFVPGTAKPSWRTGGLLLQETPDAARAADDWNRLSTLAATVEAMELVDTELAPEAVLWRLFHQEEVRVFDAEPVAFRCDCRRDSIENVLKSYSAEERKRLADPDGIIRAKCEFCGAVHEIAV